MTARQDAAPGPVWYRRWNTSNLLWLGLTGFLILIVVNPLFRLLLTSVEDSTSGAFTFANYIEAFSRVRYLVGFRNSILLGACVATLCLLLAVPMAWAVSRTDMPG